MNEICYNAEVKYFQQEVMVAEIWVERLIGRMAKSEVEIHFQKSAEWDKDKHLKCHYCSEARKVAFDRWPRVSVAP